MIHMRSYNDLTINYQGGEFDISSKILTSLAGCPEHITGMFNCGDNKLTSLIGGPQRVGGIYDCSNNQLTDLVGCPAHIDGALYCNNNNITSLVGIHKIIKSCNIISFETGKIKVGGIGLLLINNLTWISSSVRPFNLIKQYLGTGTKGMMKCRAELIAKGYADYAKL